MAILKPDKTNTLGSVTVNEFMLTKHNPNRIAMPTARLTEVIGVTVHNTDWIKTAAGTTPAEQYTRATYNGNMKDVRVHYYVDHTCAWQNLPLDLSGWHAADGDGDGDGNLKTIAIECIMSSAYNANDQKSEDNAARLAAALLKQYGLGIECLFTHSHWLNVRDGKTGDVDALNTMKNAHKNCPAYILPHWAAFKAKVAEYMSENTAEDTANDTTAEDTPVVTAPAEEQLYRVRKSWDDVKSQAGAFEVLNNAKKECDKLGGEYKVYDAKGNVVYPAESAESEEYLVRVDIPDLNIRTGPGMQYSKTGKFTGKGVFTIVETQGSWGRLKAGGWISLNYATKI